MASNVQNLCSQSYIQWHCDLVILSRHAKFIFVDVVYKTSLKFSKLFA